MIDLVLILSIIVMAASMRFITVDARENLRIQETERNLSSFPCFLLTGMKAIRGIFL